jgi:hypothetical protein
VISRIARPSGSQRFRWLDEPLERLEGATPRAAAGIPALRAALEFLLRAIENRAEHARRAGAAWLDLG